MRTSSRLKVIRGSAPGGSAARDVAPSLGDVGLLATLLVLNLMPIAGELSGIGSWSAGIVGFAVAAALLVGRELWAELRAFVRARR